jgi:homospermidine synthase
MEEEDVRRPEVEGSRRPDTDTGPRSNQSTTSHKAGWFRRKREVPVKPLNLSERFQQTLSQPDVKVHFVGAWCVGQVTTGRLLK